MLLLTLCSASCLGAEPRGNPPSLVLAQIRRDPFKFNFSAKSHIPVGTNIAGFVVVSFTPKIERRMLPSGQETTTDVSELRIKRGEKTITLVAGSAQYADYVIHFVHRNDGTRFAVRPGERFAPQEGRTLEVLNVNTQQVSCTLLDTGTGEKFTLRKDQEAQPEPPR